MPVNVPVSNRQVWQGAEHWDTCLPIRMPPTSVECFELIYVAGDHAFANPVLD